MHTFPSSARAAIMAGAIALATRDAAAAQPAKADAPPAPARDAQGILVMDGSFVHNVGNLQMNITNWGLIGSRPTLAAPYSQAPSAMWPAGSGVEYLWAAGLWIGALQAGVPAVTTGQLSLELAADPDDPRATIYRMRAGEPGGSRYPDANADDDGDGRFDEDPKNGSDDDGDGSSDEDFASIANQEFRCTMRDDVEFLVDQFPDHQPLGLEVTQESFQWEDDAVDDAVGFRWTIHNVGAGTLTDVFVGLFADCDVGPRTAGNFGDDDLVGFLRERVPVADGSLVPLDIAYMYDADGDAGRAPGYIGIVFLGHPTDPSGEHAPPEVAVRSFQQFGGDCPYDTGCGDPTSDAERYELLAGGGIDPFPTDAGEAGDYRFVISVGPFTPLDPGDQLQLDAAIVVGAGLDGLKRNAAAVALAYYGAWFDRDSDPGTGIKGRETRVCAGDLGPLDFTNPIFSLYMDCGDPPPEPPILPVDLDTEWCVYLNGDCAFEAARGSTVCTLDGTGVGEEALAGCTGIMGREFHVPWLMGLAPPSPGLRLWEAHDRIHVFWDDRSEIARDPQSGVVDFEGYQVWRADGWTRPPGSSVQTGPGSGLWKLIAAFDVVDTATIRRQLENGQWVEDRQPLGANTGLDGIGYVPQVLRPGSDSAAHFTELAQLAARIVDENPTVTRWTRVRYRDDDGDISPFGESYPELAQWACCTDQLDTLLWGELGVRFHEYIDREVHDGLFYFHAVTASDFQAEAGAIDPVPVGPGSTGSPQGNFRFSVPRSPAQTAAERDRYGPHVYVVPNPATRGSLAEFSQVAPAPGDASGVRVEFRNLPASRNRVRIYTLAGDLVSELWHDGASGNGSLAWNLVSDAGKLVGSGIYLYAVESADGSFGRVIGRFTVVW